MHLSGPYLFPPQRHLFPRIGHLIPPAGIWVRPRNERLALPRVRDVRLSSFTWWTQADPSPRGRLRPSGGRAMDRRASRFFQRQTQTRSPGRSATGSAREAAGPYGAPQPSPAVVVPFYGGTGSACCRTRCHRHDQRHGFRLRRRRAGEDRDTHCDGRYCGRCTRRARQRNRRSSPHAVEARPTRWRPSPGVQTALWRCPPGDAHAWGSSRSRDLGRAHGGEKTEAEAVAFKCCSRTGARAADIAISRARALSRSSRSRASFDRQRVDHRRRTSSINYARARPRNGTRPACSSVRVLGGGRTPPLGVRPPLGRHQRDALGLKLGLCAPDLRG